MRDGYAPPSGSEHVLPTGTLELVINLKGGDLRVAGCEKPNCFESFPGAVVCGPHTEPFVIDTSEPADLLGVHFTPGGGFPFFGVGLNELRNRRVSLRDIWGFEGEELIEQTVCAKTTAMALQTVRDALSGKARTEARLHPEVLHALSILASDLTSLQALKARSGLSSRHFERLFHTQVGMTPKRFSRVQRFQRLLSSIEGSSCVDWSALAPQHGYADQAHLINEFRSFSRITPTAYMAAHTSHRNHLPGDG